MHGAGGARRPGGPGGRRAAGREGSGDPRTAVGGLLSEARRECIAGAGGPAGNAAVEGEC